MEPVSMTSNQPYLLRAIYEWIADNGLTPYVMVDASIEPAQIPAHVIKDGKVVFNLDMEAVAGLDLGNDFIRFKARFAGASYSVSFPVHAVKAIYAQENNQGLVFAVEEGAPKSTNGVTAEDGDEPVSKKSESSPSEDAGKSAKDKGNGPHLRVIK